MDSARLDAGQPALETYQLGKRYGQVRGLRDCTIEVPAGAIVGLVGPNGAGKTTLLQMIIGLLEPSQGWVKVFGQTSLAHHAETLARVGYVAQDHPLYRDFTVADMFRFGRAMNPSWDQSLAQARAAAVGIPLNRKIKTLSGGQQAQVSLAMALAKRAQLLVLDEPVSSLDPIARLDFMRDVLAAVAETGITVIISSHVVSELERLCDWLIVLTSGQLRVAGPLDELHADHHLLTVPRATLPAEIPGVLIHRDDSDRHSTVLARFSPAELPAPLPAGWQVDSVGFEQLVLAYLRYTPRTSENDPAGSAPTRPASKAVTR
jgi:ABC-2 type transport system ATP-binding protein